MIIDYTLSGIELFYLKIFKNNKSIKIKSKNLPLKQYFCKVYRISHIIIQSKVLFSSNSMGEILFVQGGYFSIIQLIQ